MKNSTKDNKFSGIAGRFYFVSFNQKKFNTANSLAFALKVAICKKDSTTWDEGIERLKLDNKCIQFIIALVKCNANFKIIGRGNAMRLLA